MTIKSTSSLTKTLHRSKTVLLPTGHLWSKEPLCTILQETRRWGVTHALTLTLFYTGSSLLLLIITEASWSKVSWHRKRKLGSVLSQVKWCQTTQIFQWMKNLQTMRKIGWINRKITHSWGSRKSISKLLANLGLMRKRSKSSRTSRKSFRKKLRKLVEWWTSVRRSKAATTLRSLGFTLSSGTIIKSLALTAIYSHSLRSVLKSAFQLARLLSTSWRRCRSSST